MALNFYEKVVLDNAVKKAVDELVGNDAEVVSFTASELYDSICEELGFTLPKTSRNRSLDFSIKRCNIPCNRDGEVYYYDTYHIFMTGMPSLRKEKNRLYFDNMCNKEVYYDFATGTFNIENFLDKVLDVRGRKGIFADNSNFMTALKYEWLFFISELLAGYFKEYIVECWQL